MHAQVVARFSLCAEIGIGVSVGHGWGCRNKNVHASRILEKKTEAQASECTHRMAVGPGSLEVSEARVVGLGPSRTPASVESMRTSLRRPESSYEKTVEQIFSGASHATRGEDQEGTNLFGFQNRPLHPSLSLRTEKIVNNRAIVPSKMNST